MNLSINVAKNSDRYQDNDNAKVKISEDGILESGETEEDLEIVTERVREGGLPVSDETINIAKTLLPDGDQI